MKPEKRLPSKVSKQDLNKDGHLLNHEQIKAVKLYFKSNPNENKLSKNSKVLGQPNIPYSVVRADNGTLICLYKGKEKSLGEGAFGKVKLGQLLDSGEWVATKIQTMRTLGDKNLAAEVIAEDSIAHAEENEVLLDLDQLFGASHRENIYIKNIHKMLVIKRYSFMKLSYGSDLENLAKGGDLLPLDEKLDIAISILEGIDNMHNKNKYLHRDIKPGNIIWDPIERKASFVDFGAAKKLNQKGGFKVKKGLDIPGTPGYLAPEIYSQKKDKEASFINYTKETDLYAIGRTIGEVFVEHRYMRDEDSWKAFYTDDYLKDNPKLFMGFNSMHISLSPILGDNVEVPASSSEMQIISYIVKKLVSETPEDRNIVKASINILKTIRDVNIIETKVTNDLLDIIFELQEKDSIKNKKAITVLKNAYVRIVTISKDADPIERIQTINELLKKTEKQIKEIPSSLAVKRTINKFFMKILHLFRSGEKSNKNKTMKTLAAKKFITLVKGKQASMIFDFNKNVKSINKKSIPSKKRTTPFKKKP